jgi:cell wall-associated NlpC family hydrolase
MASAGNYSSDNNNKSITGNVLAGILRRKLRKKVIKLTIKIAEVITSAITPLIAMLLPCLVWLLLPILIISLICTSIGNIEMYEQECPELVRAFLSENYDEFEAKVKSLCNDEEFLSYVATMEFDNAYTKLVYGGTDAYTQEELKGNCEGVQGQSADWVTKTKDDGYSAKSVLEVIDEYKAKGLSDSQITIKDEYLEGYGAYENMEDDVLTFDKWIKPSYYYIPYYYHWNSAQSAGTKYSYFSWRDDPISYWNFACQDSIYGIFCEAGSDIWQKDDYKGPYKTMTYEDYLKKGLTSLKSKTYNKKNAPYIMQEVPLCYKQENINSWFSKALRKLKGQDQIKKYTYFTLANKKMTGADWDGKADIDNGLYVFDWFNTNSGKTTNYEKYLKDVSNKEAAAYGKRDDKTNNIVKTWKDNFAEYFSKEIYYTYSNRDYIVDYFLSDNVSRDKKIAFLQRSFYAMATGSSLDVNLKEEYKLQNGQIVNCATANIVGAVGITAYEFYGTKPLQITFYDKDFTNDFVTIDVNSYKALKKEIKNAKKTSINTVGRVIYSTNLKLTFADGKTETLKNIQLTYGKNYEGSKTENDCYIVFNTDLISTSATKRYGSEDLTEIFKKHIEWDSDYYEQQAEWENDTFDGTESEATLKGNPLDDITLECDEWYFENSSVSKTDGNLTTKDLSKKSIEKILKDSIKCTDETDPTTGIEGMVSGKLSGTREIKLEYSDHSFLTYDVTEKKDSSGNVSGVNIEIYTYFPDLSAYDEGEYRIAYGFETSGAVTEAFKLLQYYKKNNTLTGVKNEVDFDQLFIPKSGEWAEKGYITEDGDLKTFIADMLISVESGGNWSDAHNASYLAEKTITVGIMQWYGERAHNLLRAMCKSKAKKAKEILGKTLYEECLSNSDWESSRKAFSESDLEKIREMLGSEWGKVIQEDQIQKDVEGYIKTAQGLGLTNDKLIAYFCNLTHQNPTNARAVVADLGSAYGSIKAANESEDALDKMYTLSLNYSGYYATASRHKTCYEKCKSLNVLTTNINVASSKKAKKAIQYAVSKSGCAYSQAYRNSGNMFDCSSLMYYAWKYAGVDISNGAGSGANTVNELKWCESNATLICTSYDASKLKAGDLIFFDTNTSHYRNVGHVAMYIGNGQVVEAGDPVGVYNVSNWHTSNFLEAYRITK